MQVRFRTFSLGMVCGYVGGVIIQNWFVNNENNGIYPKMWKTIEAFVFPVIFVVSGYFLLLHTKMDVETVDGLVIETLDFNLKNIDKIMGMCTKVTSEHHK
eukprot:UN09110